MWTLRLSLALVLSLAFVANGYVTQKEFQRRHENGELNFELSIAEILRLIGTGEYSAYNPPQMPHCVVQEPTRYRNDAPMRGKPGEPRQKPVPVGVGKPETEGVEEAEVIVDLCLCGAGLPIIENDCDCIAPATTEYLYVVQKLVDELAVNTELNTAFEDAVAAVNALDVSTAQCIKTVTDYVNFADQILRTPPYQDGNSRNVYNAISTFYLYMQQPTLLALQSPVEPGTTKNGTTQQQLTWLSAWLREYAIEWGVYLDTDQSATCVDTFKDDEWFCWDDYLIPDEGFRTFNEYFARDFINLNIRPVNCSDDPDAVVFPADATFMHSYNISDVGDMDTNNPNELINAKGLVWSIQELLFLSEYRNEFNGGVFAHSFLSTYNYHRWHAPVAGTIVERRVISGQFYLDVTTLTNHEGDVIPDALDDAGYQFVMQRGLIVIEADNPDIGLVACLPMGMAQVSSIYYTVEVGDHVDKGDELGTFYFGGSDFVVVFQEKARFTPMVTPYIQYYVRQFYGWTGTKQPRDERPQCSEPVDIIWPEPYSEPDEEH